MFFKLADLGGLRKFYSGYKQVTSKRKKTTTQQTETNLNEKKVNHFDR